MIPDLLQASYLLTVTVKQNTSKTSIKPRFWKVQIKWGHRKPATLTIDPNHSQP